MPDPGTPLDRASRHRPSGLSWPRLGAAIPALIIAAISAGAVAGEGPSPRQLLVTILTEAGPRPVTAEIACTLEERGRGLMGRESLAPGQGMIFFLPEPRLMHMWMRDTIIPLDMVFFDKDRKIIKIERNTQVMSERIIGSGAPVIGVLELAGGQADNLKITNKNRLLYEFSHEQCE